MGQAISSSARNNNPGDTVTRLKLGHQTAAYRPSKVKEKVPRLLSDRSDACLRWRCGSPFRRQKPREEPGALAALS